MARRFQRENRQSGAGFAGQVQGRQTAGQESGHVSSQGPDPFRPRRLQITLPSLKSRQLPTIPGLFGGYGKMTSKGFQTSTLIDSIRAGDIGRVIDALEAGADIEEADMHGTRGLPLRTACFEGNEVIVRELLARGANPNASASDGPSAPLRLALRCSHKKIAALLLQRGAQPPAGTAIDPSIFFLEVAPLAWEPPATSLPGGVADNLIEFTRTEIAVDQDTTESCGTETNALSMDLLFMDMKDSQQDSNGKERPTESGKTPTA